MRPYRIWPLLGFSLREAVHLRLAWAVGLAALMFVAGASVLREFNFGVEEGRFFADLAGGTVMLFGTVQAILLTVTLVQGGIATGMPGLLFARGVRRAEWLVACLGAVWVSQAALAVSAYALLGLVLAWHGHAVAGASLGATCALRFLHLALIAVFALLMSVVCRSPVLATVLALALTLAAQLSPVVAWAAAHGRPATRLAWPVLGLLWPDFAAFGDGAAPASAVVTAGVYAAGYVSAACLLLSGREI